jgi:hypothetical protein
MRICDPLPLMYLDLRVHGRTYDMARSLSFYFIPKREAS